MVAVTQFMSGCRIASSTRGNYHLREIISRPCLSRIFPETAQRPPEEVGYPDDADPEGRREEAGEDVRWVVNAQVEAREADEEDEDDASRDHCPAPKTPKAPGYEQGQRAVEADGDG